MPVTLPDILNAVYDVMDAAEAAGTILPYQKENKEHPNNSKPHTEVLVRPQRNRKNTVKGVTVNGFIVFNTYFHKGDGAIDPSIEGEKLIQLFPEGMVLGGVEISEEGYTRGPQKGVDAREGWMLTPTIIPYEAISCPNP